MRQALDRLLVRLVLAHLRVQVNKDMTKKEKMDRRSAQKKRKGWRKRRDAYLARGVVIIEDRATCDDARGEHGTAARAGGRPLFDGTAARRAVELAFCWWVVWREPLKEKCE